MPSNIACDVSNCTLRVKKNLAKLAVNRFGPYDIDNTAVFDGKSIIWYTGNINERCQNADIVNMHTFRKGLKKHANSVQTQ